ncbi:MAG: T9SS type A sorting domain-containing protein [Candidatus Delongbacteria bacterium]|nr:T9SS type A sorting domain-containing protein [Candidatus Delongbacteria bacterium]
MKCFVLVILFLTYYSFSEIWSYQTDGYVYFLNNQIIIDSDNNYIVGGNIEIDRVSNFYPVLYKYDINGNLLTLKDFNIQQFEYIEDLILVENNNYFLVTTISNSGPGNEVTRIIKLNPNFDIIWQKEIDFLPNCGKTALLNSDGDYLISYVKQKPTTNKCVLVVDKIDKNNGELIWRHEVGPSYEEITIRPITLCNSDSSFVTFSGYWDLDKDINRIFFVKHDQSGNLLESRVLTDSTTAILISVEKTRSGEFLLSGQRRLSVPKFKSMMMKLGSNMNVLWDRTEDINNKNNACQKLIEASNSTLIAIGFKNSESSINSDIYFRNLDQDGNILLESNIKSQLNIGENFLVDVVETTDNDFITVGALYHTDYSAKALIAVFDKDGNHNVKIEESNEENSVKRYHLIGNYPNPYNPSTTIKYSLEVKSDVKILVFNGNGEKLFESGLISSKIGENKFELNTNSFSSGTYIYSLEVNGKTVDSKSMTLIK